MSLNRLTATLTLRQAEFVSKTVILMGGQSLGHRMTDTQLVTPMQTEKAKKKCFLPLHVSRD